LDKIKNLFEKFMNQRKVNKKNFKN
jgi:hypothetical protein